MGRNRGAATRTRGWGRYVGAGSAGLAVAVAALMALAPATLGNGVTIPIKSFGVTISTSTTAGACGHAKIVKSLTFSSTTGDLKGAVAAKSPACSHRVSANEAYATDSMNLVNPNFRFPHSGSYKMFVNWSFTVNESWSMTPYTSCTLNYADPNSLCMVYTEDTIYAQPYLYDQSNSSWNGYGFNFSSPVDIYLKSFAYVENTTFGNFSFGVPGPGSFSGTLKGTNTFSLSGAAAINASNHFTFDIIFEIQTLTFAYAQDARTTGAASAAATIDMASGSNIGHLIVIKLV